MVYNSFKELSLSRLGFGAMRLPLKEDKSIDEAAVFEMVDYAMSHGVNYFDTAYPYHGGYSEVVLGEALNRYPRDTWYLATKYPGHQIADTYDPAAVFEDQLKKCGVEYFDFYLLHNVYENSIGVYLDPKWGIVDYFKEQVKNGRIRHLGFSCHGRPETLEYFLDQVGDCMEFCQIQLNYLDWTLQDAKTKYELLASRNIPVWVMEPLRGGRLAKLSEEDESRLKALRPAESTASWSFRYLMNLPNVKMILSGMSAPEQMWDNVRTFSEGDPQTEEETKLLLEIAEGLKGAVPCTRCRYCCDGCPQELDIPMLIHAYNDLKFSGRNMMISMQFDALPEEKLPSACIGCGACAAVCPQGIDIPSIMPKLDEMLKNSPSWAQVCKERAEAARKLAEAAKR